MIVNDVRIYKEGRNPREDKGKLKHSIRRYVEARMSYSNIPIQLKDVFIQYPDIFDKGICNLNRRLLLPLSKKRRCYGSFFKNY